MLWTGNLGNVFVTADSNSSKYTLYTFLIQNIHVLGICLTLFKMFLAPTHSFLYLGSTMHLGIFHQTSAKLPETDSDINQFAVM